MDYTYVISVLFIYYMELLDSILTVAMPVHKKINLNIFYKKKVDLACKKRQFYWKREYF